MESESHSVFSRAEWARLRSSVPMMLSEAEVEALRGTNEPTSMDEVEEVFLPLTRLINLHVAASRGLARVTDDFVGRPSWPRPYIVAVAGSVAVGKSTVARLLRALLSRWPDHPKVDLVTTDGFLFPTRELEKRGLMGRKGFPESYDVKRMICFLSDMRATGRAVSPVYSHQAYDILAGEEHVVDRPDILIFEGLNVLQLGAGIEKAHAPVFTASDFFDISIYIDAEEQNIERWYLERFLLLQRTAFQNPASYFHHMASVPLEESEAFAMNLWSRINGPNLRENILPSRSRADVILHKRADHGVDWLKLRRL
ncbi:pantothenate kinase [Sphingomonas laterariae]|uniref:Pantothenate kinase n=1 Tax=Edaphosphingomonas laterariae TaxID=861865 RepID=A0A239GZA6_9SPHN|nr:type I pantothenate kinase [Sphingomonas laterariae]SNS74232.1 pantothenate kinase [Sphingomonas laterariae]